MKRSVNFNPETVITAALLVTFFVLWAIYSVRSFKKDFVDYAKVRTLSTEEKHAYILGEDLYGFLDFCRRKLPGRASFELAADLNVYKTSRFLYYIYPHRVSETADYIVVYNKKSFRKQGYRVFSEFDSSGRILKKE